MSARKVLGWILLTSAVALAVGGSVVVARHLITQGRSNPSRIIDGCNRMLSRLERKLQGRGSEASAAGVGS